VKNRNTVSVVYSVYMKRMREKISLNLLATEYLTKLAGLESDSIIGEL